MLPAMATQKKTQPQTHGILSLRVKLSLLRRFDAVRTKENRPKSNMLEVLLTEALDARDARPKPRAYMAPLSRRLRRRLLL